MRAGNGNVRIWGTSPDSIDAAEDRDRWMALLTSLDIRQPAGGLATNEAEALEIANGVSERARAGGLVGAGPAGAAPRRRGAREAGIAGAGVLCRGVRRCRRGTPAVLAGRSPALSCTRCPPPPSPLLLRLHCSWATP